MLDMNVGLIGYPVEHSLSPKVHNSVYEALGIPWRFGLVPAPSESDAAAAIAEGRSRALFARAPEEMMAGFNVTMPHKRIAFDMAERKNVSSFVAGNANTLSFSEECSGGTCGYVLSCDTTDGEGACRALENSGAQIEGANVLILGTGGAASSIFASVLMRGAADVKVATRSRGKGIDVVAGILARAEIASSDGMLELWGFGDDSRTAKWKTRVPEEIVVEYDEASATCRRADIVINATPLGMKEDDPSPLPPSAFSSGQMAMDVVYAHGTSEFAKLASEAGARTMDGLSMLVEQAILSMSVWFDIAGFEFSTRDDAVYSAIRQAGIDLPYASGDAAASDAPSGAVDRSHDAISGDA